jgi:hypothetical protein
MELKKSGRNVSQYVHSSANARPFFFNQLPFAGKRRNGGITRHHNAALVALASGIRPLPPHSLHGGG